MEQKKTSRTLLWIVFIVYFVLLFRLLILKSWGGFSYIAQCYADFDSWKQETLWRINIIPLNFIFAAPEYNFFTFCKNVIGNILLFLPLGFFLLYLSPKVRAWSVSRYFWIMAAVIFGVELAQLLLMCGQFDIHHFLLNLLGACLGYMAAKRIIKGKETQ